MTEPTKTVTIFPALVWLPSIRGPTPQVWYQAHTRDQKPVKVLSSFPLWASDLGLTLAQLVAKYPYMEVVENAKSHEASGRTGKLMQEPVTPIGDRTAS